MASKEFLAQLEKYKKGGYAATLPKQEEKKQITKDIVKAVEKKPLKSFAEASPSKPESKYDFTKTPTQNKPLKSAEDLTKNVSSLKDIADVKKPPKYDFTKTPESNLQASGKLRSVFTGQSAEDYRKAEVAKIQPSYAPQSEWSRNLEYDKAGRIGSILKTSDAIFQGIGKGAGITSAMNGQGMNTSALDRPLEPTHMISPSVPLIGGTSFNLPEVAGQVIGSILPGMGAQKGATKLLSPVLGGLKNKALNTIATETVAGGLFGGLYPALEGRNPLPEAATGAGLGALTAGAGIGIARGTQNLFKGATATRQLLGDYTNRNQIYDDLFSLPQSDRMGKTADELYTGARQDIKDAYSQKPNLPNYEAIKRAEEAARRSENVQARNFVYPTENAQKNMKNLNILDRKPYPIENVNKGNPSTLQKEIKAPSKPLEQSKIRKGKSIQESNKNQSQVNVEVKPNIKPQVNQTIKDMPVQPIIQPTTKPTLQTKVAPAIENPTPTKIESTPKTFKLSKTRTNTIERTTELSQKAKQYLSEEEFGYEPQSKIEWQADATKRFVNNKQSIIDDLMSDKPSTGGKDAFEQSMVIKEAEKQALKTKTFDTLLSYTKKYAEKIRENARALKAHDLAWEKTPTISNTLIKAQSKIDALETAVYKAKPKLKETIKNETLALKEKTMKAIEATASEITNKLKLNLQLFGNISPDSMKKFITKHYSSNPTQRGELVESVLNKFKLQRSEAEELAKTIEKMFDVNFQKVSDNYLKNLLKSDKSTKVSFEKVMKLIKSGAYDDVNISNIIKEKYNLPILTPDDASKIFGMVEKLNTLKVDTAEHQILMAQIKNVIDQKIKSTPSQILNEVITTGLLGNVKTQLANVGGNVPMAITEVGGNVVFAPTYDKLVRKFAEKFMGQKAERTASMPDLRLMFKSAAEGTKTTIEDALGGLQFKNLKGLSVYEKTRKIMSAIWEAEPIQRKGIGDVDKFRLGNKLYTPKDIYINGKRIPIASEISRAIRITANAVKTSSQLIDTPFSNAYYKDLINQYKKANKTDIIPDAVKEMASNVARERVYADMNYISMVAEGIRNLPETAYRVIGNKAPESLQPLLKKATDAMQIYFNAMGRFGFTTANLGKRALEHTPLGTVEGLALLGLAKRSGVMTPTQQRRIVDLLTRSTTGTLLGAGFYGLAKSGKITGKEKQDFQAETLKTQAQLLPYSFKFGNKTVTFDWLQPHSYLAIMAQKLLKDNKDDSGVLDMLISMAESTVDVYSEQPFAQSMARLSGKYSSPDETVGERVLASTLELPKQMVLTLLKQTAAYTDPYKRETYSEKFLEKNLINPVKAGIPGLRQTLPKKIGLLGSDQKEYYGNNNFVNSFIARWRTGEYNPNPVEREMITLYDKTKNVDVIPAYAPKVVKYDDNKIFLTGEQRTQYQKDLGEYTTEYVSRLIKSSSYQSLKSNDDKIRNIKSVIDNSRDYATDKFKKRLGIKVDTKESKSSKKVKIPKKSKKGKY